MKSLNLFFSELNNNQLRLFTALFSLLLSILAFTNDQLINSDGVLYMNMAKAYIDGGLEATASMFDWPFFSILIAKLHQLTGLNTEFSGQIINGFLFVVFTDALILISSKLLINTKHVFIAALLILCFSTLNDYRSYIIRDIGYWAFISISIYRTLLFIEKPNWLNGFYWQLSSLLALLFRVEAIVIILTTPLFIVFQLGFKEGLKSTVKLCSFFLLTAALSAAIFTHKQGLMNAFGKVLSVTQFLDYSTITDEFHTKTTIFGSELLNQYSERYSGMIFASGLIYMLLAKIISGLSPVNLILYVFAKLDPSRSSNNNTRRFLLFFICVNLVILTAFLFKHYFMSTRYAVMLITAIMLLMLPAICRLIDEQWQAKNKFALLLVPFLLTASLVDTFTISVTKGYIKETAIWASQHLPENSRALTNDIFIDFYFHENEPKTQLKLNRELGGSPDFDYLIVVEKKSHLDEEKAYSNWTLEPVHQSQNARGDRAIVYRNILANPIKD